MPKGKACMFVSPSFCGSFWLGLVFLLLVLPCAAAPETASYPLPAPAKNPKSLGLGVQRAMTLLATSTPQHRNHVRILFYGQSITEQDWSKQVAADLRRRFPFADLEIENRAIGGFAAQWLVRPAEHDLYPFAPDLLIFHVYGSDKDYEDLIRSVRTRTSAEVLMQNDHVTAWPPAVPDEKTDKSAWWDDHMNRHFLPETAAKYGCGLADVRGPWLEYLKTNNLEPKALLKDGVHLNEWGNFLMARLVGRCLVYRPDLPQTARNMVRTYQIGKDAKWKSGKLTLDFDGSRVDILPNAKTAKSGASVAVTIDGKKPSAIPDIYAITRPQPGPWSPLFIKRVDHEMPLLAETWTLKITQVNADSTAWNFDVRGSVTGADGSGDSSKMFVSRSGRVKIDPTDFFRNGMVPVGYELSWRAMPMGMDVYAPPSGLDPTLENASTLAQGLVNGHHTLTLSCPDSARPALRALRVFTPPLK